MIEFEARFSLERDLRSELSALGFLPAGKKKMSDIIFEPKDWIPGTGLRPGYFVVRIRLVEGQKPRAEIKEYLDDMRWNETGFEIPDARKLVEFFSKIMIPSKVISKQREVWKSDSVEIALDEVEKVGSFIEVEGEENSVKKTISTLGFDLKDKKPPYGTIMFYMEKEGKISFSLDEIETALKNFGF